MEQNKRKEYRIQGLTCTSCALEFETRVNRIPGIKNAKVNFGASKIMVEGSISIEQLEKAGSFDNLKIVTDTSLFTQNPFWKERRNITLLLSIILLICGWAKIAGIDSRVFFAAVIILSGYSLFIEGIKSVIKLRFNIKSLIMIAITGAVILQEWEEGATLVVLFTISEALERYSMDRARNSIRSLLKLSPNEALVRRKDTMLKVPVGDVQIGDMLIIKPGQKVAIDGVVVKGSSTINQSTITGESIPVPKQQGDKVFAGTINEDGFLEVRATKKFADSTLSQIIHLVEEAQEEKAPAEVFVDRFAKVYTPLIILISLLVSIVPPIFFSANWKTWIYEGLSLLVIGCPCALVISTPISIVTAIGNAAKKGVIIKGGTYLEKLSQITAIAFDKTGTITEGKPTITDIISFTEKSTTEYLEIAAQLSKHSQHPLSYAIIKKAGNIENKEVKNFISLVGKGIQAEIDSIQYFLGSLSLIEKKVTYLNKEIFKVSKDLEEQGRSVMLLGAKNQILALIGVEDPIREESKNVLRNLKNLGEVILLTGDNKLIAQTIGQRVGITKIIANLLPEQKQEEIKNLEISGTKTAMIGDGVNDTPALAQASVGIAMGKVGSDVALDTADVVLMNDDLSKLPFLFRLSKKTLRIIKQNVALSLVLKVVALLLVIPGWLTLWLAIVADMGATLLVSLNALRLLKSN